MIRGTIFENKKYDNERINIALDWLVKNEEIEKGVYEINGKEIYAIVQEYNSEKIEELKWEGHKKYIDIQYIADGKEEIGYSDIKNMKPECEYNEEGDYQFFTGEGKIEALSKGDYMVLYPEDIHMPCIGEGNIVKKIVVKVRI